MARTTPSLQQQLSQNIKSNFKTYLSRMARSANFSTKTNIPAIVRANDCKRVLDVGCADGAFTEMIAFANSQANVVGIDINPECIKEAERRSMNNGPALTYNCAELGEVEGLFDCIVFSSVMHEISSYCEEGSGSHEVASGRYTYTPIEDAIKEAYKHLAWGGIIIIRDWVDCSYGHLLRVKFKSLEYSEMFKRFQEEFPALDKISEGRQMVYEDDTIPDGYLVCERFFMEYLMVATWGKESWMREINERKFICRKDKWYDMAEAANLSVVGWMETTEEYPLYCERIAEVTVGPDKWHMPDTTFVMVCRKDN